MTDSFNKLRKTLFAELNNLHQGTDAEAKAQPIVHFGVFLEACLGNLGQSRAYFAKQLDIERDLADAILDGLLPESEIGDDFLVEIAGVVNYEPNVLRVMLGREIQPTRLDDNTKGSQTLG